MLPGHSESNITSTKVKPMKNLIIKLSLALFLVSATACTRITEEGTDIESGLLCTPGYDLEWGDWCLRSSVKYLIGYPNIPCYDSLLISYPDTITDSSNRPFSKIYGTYKREDIMHPIDFSFDGKVKFYPWEGCYEDEVNSTLVIEFEMQSFADTIISEYKREVTFYIHYQNENLSDTIKSEFKPYNF